MTLQMMLHFLFTCKDRAILLFLTLLMILSGVLEVFSLGMLFPYVQILEDPTRISSVRYVREVYEWFGFGSHRNFLIAVSLALLLTFAVKGVVTLWVTNFQLMFVNAKLADLGSTLLSRYL